jgi:hypothetical protein
MLPNQLKAEQFEAYPPQARQVARDRLGLLQQLPVALVPLLLRELINYDWKFPAEQKDLDRQLAYLGSLSAGERQQLLAGFERLRLPPELNHFDWVKDPGQYSERFSASLWATHQIDAFRAAALDYGRRVDSSQTPEPLPVARLGIVVLGQAVAESKHPLFRKLRKQGVHFSRVKPENGVRTLVDAVVARATAHPVPYRHWYIDGGAPASASCAGLTSVSYQSLEAVRTALLSKMEKAIRSGIGGPEALRTMMAKMRPEELGLSGEAGATVMNHFQVSVLTEGSGTQIFSTTFVQWAAKEALARAQPVTLLARFAPRQRARPMNELIAAPQQAPTPDPEGSLIDADMGAYLTWVNLRRLSGAKRSAFLVWFEDHSEAVAIGPSLPRGTESDSPLSLQQLLDMMA